MVGLRVWLHVEAVSQLPVHQLAKSVAAVRDVVGVSVGWPPKNKRDHRPWSVGDDLETDLHIGSVEPDRRPHQRARPVAVEDRRSHLARTNVEPRSDVPFERIRQRIPHHPRWRRLAPALPRQLDQIRHGRTIRRPDRCAARFRRVVARPGMPVRGRTLGVPQTGPSGRPRHPARALKPSTREFGLGVALG